jgi:K+-transporting ATPase ATPase A chain
MSYFTQMAGLAYHNFVSAAVGISLAVAFIRGIARKESETIGNFWVDFVRANLYVLLPLCFVFALALVSQGVVQNFRPYDMAKLVDPQTIEVDKKDESGAVLTNPDGTNQKETKVVAEQTIAQGPVASQEAVKMLGTNGGGFFNTNSAHPFENPTPLSNFLEMVAIFAIGAGLTYTLGRMTGSQRHGWAVLAAMVVLFLAGLVTAYWAEAGGNPILTGVGVDQTASASPTAAEAKL